MQVLMSWRQAWHTKGCLRAISAVLCTLCILTARPTASENAQGCPEGPQGQRVAEAAAAADVDGGAPYLFQKQVLLERASKRICHNLQCRYNLASALSEPPAVLRKGFHDRAHCAHRCRDHVRIRAQPGHASIPYPSTGTTCAPFGLMLAAAGLPT